MSENGVTLEAVYQLMGLVAGDVRDLRRDMRTEIANVRRDIEVCKQDVEGFKGEVRADIASLRQAVGAYHATVLGHGILISELDDPVRRIEQHLNLSRKV